MGIGGIDREWKGERLMDDFLLPKRNRDKGAQVRRNFIIFCHKCHTST